MILKILHSNDRPSLFTLIDKIDSVIMEEIELAPMANFDSENPDTPDVVIIDPEIERAELTRPMSKDEAEHYRRVLPKVVCVMDTGDTTSVTFNTTAYICNDDGKTIERIAA